MSSGDFEQVLVADRDLWVLSVVADTIRGFVAAGDEAVVEMVEKRLSFNQSVIVASDRLYDVSHHGGVFGDVQRIRFAWVLEEVEEEQK